jgi:PAS domain S-box-containing protein
MVTTTAKSAKYIFIKGNVSKKDDEMGPRKEFQKKQDSAPVDDALRASEAAYRRLFETARDGILIIDADSGRITDVNPFLVNMLGYARKDFIGKALWRLGPFRDIRASKAAFQNLIRTGYIRYDHLPLETRDGRSIEVEFISNVYQVGPKRTIQCNIRDNSQRKQAERTSLRLEAQLKQAQKMDAVAALAGGIAHQFNNALTVISGGLGLLEDESYEVTDGYLQSMNRAVDRMSRLTRQLLAYARGGKYSLETMLLSDLVANSLPALKSILKPSIVVETDTPSGLPQIHADRDQLQISMLAILANASEAIEEQGLIRIICRKEVMTDERVKAFAGLMPGIYVSLSITDNGKGMDEKTRSRVFEPFFTTHFPGRGLGMAAVYGMVKNHGGWISVESQVDHGTMVCIYLPAAGSKEETIQRSLLPDSGLKTFSAQGSVCS